MNNILKKETEALALDKPPAYLRVNSYGLFSSAQFTNLEFVNHKVVGTFAISASLEYTPDTNASLKHSKLIPKARFQSLVGRNLREDFNIANTMKDYKPYSQLKERFFVKWLSDNKYFEGVQQKKFKKPDFICFGSRITDTLKTPGVTRFKDWKIYGVKFNDTIYIWEIKDMSGQTNLESYPGVYFEHILTHEDPKSTVPNEYEKVFTIQETTFGSHQLLCANEIDAVDEYGHFVEIKVFKKSSPKAMAAKHLHCWSQSVVAGIQNLMIGVRNENYILTKVESINPATLVARNTREWTPRACYDFEHRLLGWIKSQFIENDLGKVKMFSWKCGDSVVHAKDAPTNNLLVFTEINRLIKT